MLIIIIIIIIPLKQIKAKSYIHTLIKNKIISNFNLIYYRANLTTRRPITKRAPEEKRNKNTHIRTKHNTRKF
jgi:hypothetical protein